MRRFLIFICAIAVALAVATHSRAYQYTGFKWAGATTAFSVDISGNSLWNTAFENAMAEWNSRTAFRYTIIHQAADPCLSNDGKNGVAFGSTVCGTAFGSSTLAVTRTSYFGQTASDTGIIFNSAFTWNVYSGPWQNSPFDFKRVAVHELGHALGLDHETNALAIMAPTAGYIEVPQTDDINGVNALYGSSTSSDATPPALTITSHANGQTVTSASITIAGTSTDSGAGDNGISAVTVNGAIANGGLVTGAAVANWSKDITLSAGANLITVVATDASPNHNATTRTITINLSSTLTITSPSTLTSGAVGSAYVLALTASGGAPSYSWSITSGSLPPGLTLSTAGVLSGTPTTAGTFSFTVTVTDSVGANASKAVQLAVTSGGDILLTSKTASPYHVFPQFADGFFADRTYYRSSLIVTNTAASAANCTLQLYGMTSNSSSSFSFSVATVYTFRTNGTQSFQNGYATLRCGSAVEAEVVYSFYAPNNVKVSEATVFSSPAAASLRIVSDAREGARLGLAIANDSDQSASYTVRVYDSTGNPIGTPTITLSARQARASFLDEIVSLPANHYGIVDVVANGGAASMIGLRFTGSVFTTIPATMLSAPGAPSGTYHVFPQFADGFFGDRTYYRSTMIITNAGPTTSCTLQLYGVSINNSRTFTVNVPGASTFSTSGVQSFQQGYATLRCAAAVEAEVVYSFYSSSGVKVSEATVFSSPSTASLRIVSDAREGERLGLAIANDSDQSGSYTIRVYDTNGVQIGSTLVTLNARQARAAFLDELTTLPSGHYGAVDVTTNSGTISMIGLRFTGSAFTTIPAAIR